MNTRVLAICGDGWHPAATVRQGLEPLRGSGFDFEFWENDEAPAEGRVNKFPVVLLARANVTGDSQPWLAAESQEIFPKYVRCGNGLIVLHGGISRYEELPAMNALLGGAFVRHPDPCDVQIEPKRTCAITQQVTPFAVRDEQYIVETRPDVEIFLQSRSARGIQPAGWTRAEKEGRVCVLTPGHNLEVWLHPEFQKLLLNAMRWTAKLS